MKRTTENGRGRNGSIHPAAMGASRPGPVSGPGTQLRRALAEQSKELRRLAAKIDRVERRNRALEAALAKLKDVLGNVRQPIAGQAESPRSTTLATKAKRPMPAKARMPETAYQKMVVGIRRAVAKRLPRGARILVVSKGDDQLLMLDGREARHFPQREDGVYLGYYQADGAGAVEHLEALRKKGAQYLVLPRTAFWWLDHYKEFASRLAGRYRLVVGNGSCRIYQLFKVTRETNGDVAAGAWARLWKPNFGLTTSTDPGTPPGVAAPPALRRHRATAAVAVCVHNAPDEVRECLESVVRYTSAPYSLVLVDDGSDAPTREYLAEFAASQGATLIRNRVAKGYTFAANQGLRRSKAQYTVLLNSDTVVTPDWLDRMITCAESDPKIGLVGPLSNTASWQSVPNVIDDERGDWAENPLPAGVSPTDVARNVARQSGRLYPRLAFLNGFCLMFRRGILRELGYFDERSFGRGYGEENDYCLRATKAGWQLAVADDAYVFHRQSRSYSHDRRKVLSRLANETLAQKHGQRIILRGVEQSRTSRVMEGIRARARVLPIRQQLVSQARQKWEGLRVAFVLPVAEAAGGANVVLQEAAAMREMGVDARIVNLERHRLGFEAGYPDKTVPVIYAKRESDVAELAVGYDAMVATFYKSVEWLSGKRFSGGGCVRGYYVQDFEPNFFVPGSEGFLAARRSYTAYPDLVRVTKTQWNRDTVRRQLGVDCTVIGPSVDLDLHRPRTSVADRDESGSPVRVLAMVRPSSPRRAPQMTLEVLRRLQESLGDGVDISIFGCAADDADFLAMKGTSRFKVLGPLTRPQVAWALSRADVFADFSTFQAMGLTALEAMAGGAAVIVPRAGGAGTFALHEVNALVADTESAEACLDAITRLATDQDLRSRLRARAIHDVCEFFPERAAYNMLRALLGNRSGCDAPIGNRVPRSNGYAKRSRH